MRKENSLYQLNLGNRVVSSYRQYKTIKLKLKINKIAILLAIVLFLLSLFVATGTLFYVSAGAFIVIVLTVFFLYRGKLDFMVLKLSRVIDPRKKKMKYTEVK